MSGRGRQPTFDDRPPLPSDGYDWAQKRMRHRVRGPTNNLPELIEERSEFVRPYRGTAPGVIDLPPSPQYQPHSPPAQPQLSTYYPMEQEAQTVSAPMPAATSAARQTPFVLVEASRTRPALRSATAAPAAMDPPTASRDEPIGYTYLPPEDGGEAVTYPAPAADLHLDGESVSESLNRRVREAGLHECVQYYAREYLGYADAPGGRSVIPLTEGLVVYSIARLDQALSDKVAEVCKLQLDLQEEKQKGTDAAPRLRRETL
jgi:hypothetical protein